MKIHPAADIFPTLEGPDFAAFVEDIQRHGLITPLELWDGKLIDGRNRLRACKKLGIEPDLVEVAHNGEDDPVDYVLSLNLHRRHLGTSQRAMVAGRVRGHYDEQAKGRQGRRRDLRAKVPGSSPSSQPELRARDEAGAALNVSGKTVDAASKVLDKGSKELVRAVDRGEVAVSAAAKLADKPKSEQTAIVKGGKAAVREAAKAPTRRVEFPASKAFESLLTHLVATSTYVRVDYGSMTKMMKDSEWDPSVNGYVVSQLETLGERVQQWLTEARTIHEAR